MYPVFPISLLTCLFSVLFNWKLTRINSFQRFIQRPSRSLLRGPQRSACPKSSTRSETEICFVGFTHDSINLQDCFYENRHYRFFILLKVNGKTVRESARMTVGTVAAF